jgi:nitric oxide reductase NorE protein
MTTVTYPPAEVKKRDLPGGFAMWIFIFAELVVFGIFFLTYAYTRANNVALFNQYQQHLERETGAINTVVLITSSFFVVLAVSAIRQNAAMHCANWIILAVLMGGVFAYLKLLEFAAKHSDGITLSSNTFYMFYLSLTFFHFMHVLLGMVILAVVAVKAWQRAYNAENHTGVETGTSYWHMVDLV